MASSDSTTLPRSGTTPIGNGGGTPTSDSVVAGRMPSTTTPMIANVNSRSVSLASVSSEGSTESHVVEQEEMMALTQDVRCLKEALGRLRRVFNPDLEGNETLRVASHERLGEVLKILRHMLEKYPLLQSNELVGSAGHLIHHVRTYNYDDENIDPREFHEALDALALAFSSRVSEYLMGDLDSNMSLSSSSSRTKSCENLLDNQLEGVEVKDEILTPEQIDAVLMRHDQGVDHALNRAKIWSKYAKDVMTYVDKRTNMELEFARNLTKLAQSMRPILKEESYLPFQSIYCTALDQDLDMCGLIQQTCGFLQGHKFMEPLSARRSDHERARKSLKERWHRELKRMHDSAMSLRKARGQYMQRQQEYERCKEAVRIAEQGAEIGATGENKVDKRKRLEEEALQKTTEAENIYRQYVSEANERHRNLLIVKSEVLQKIRELILQCDQTMKAVTVEYFKLQHTLNVPIPVQFQTLCESSRLYEPGSQFMEYVRRMPEPISTRFSSTDPFNFEPYNEEQLLMFERQRRSSASLESNDDAAAAANTGTYRFRGDRGPTVAWGAPAAVEPSDTESVESRDESCKSRDTSPSASPMVQSRVPPPAAPPAISSSEEVENEHESGSTGRSKIQLMSRAAVTHRFRKLITPSKCRECDSYVYFQGYECQDCGLASHKKCLETLALQCGHKRLPHRKTTFGADLGQHLLQTGAQVPPLVCRCVNEIDQRGLRVKGIYRVSAAKLKVEKLCQAFENGAELVELTEFHPMVISAVLKLYMRELPEPLLTFKLYHEFITVGRRYPAETPLTPEQEEKAIVELRDLCRKLPRAHLRTLGFLVHHLKRVVAEYEVNNMNATNLGIVFGPSVMRSSEDPASLAHIADTMIQARVITLLIEHASEIFGSPESVLPRDYARYTASGYRAPQPGRSGSSEVFSSQTERRGESQEEVSLPGLVIDKDPEAKEYNPVLEALLASQQQTDDEDAEPIPDFLLPDSSSKTKKSPLLARGSSSPPNIIKQSLKNFSGLEGVTVGMLSAQDSLEVAQRGLKFSTSTDSAGSGTAPTPTTATPTQSTPQRRSVQESRSESLFAKVGKAAKKHSIDEENEDHHNHHHHHHHEEKRAPKSHPPRTSLTIGVGDHSMPIGGRSSSLSDDVVDSRGHPRTKCVITTTGVTAAGGMSQSLPSTILNLDENKVKIQVPGLRSIPSAGAKAPITKQSSIDKGDD